MRRKKVIVAWGVAKIDGSAFADGKTYFQEICHDVRDPDDVIDAEDWAKSQMEEMRGRFVNIAEDVQLTYEIRR